MVLIFWGLKFQIKCNYMKLIILNGSSCSGKSSIVKILMKSNKNLFHLHYDSIKWFFSNYSRDEQFQDVQIILRSIARSVFEMDKYNVICDSGLYQENRQTLINIAKEFNYEVVEINLESDFDVLLKRFNERVESALKVPEKDRRISNLSTDRFKELYEIYNSEKNSDAIIFRTDIESPEEISEKINKMF